MPIPKPLYVFLTALLLASAAHAQQEPKPGYQVVDSEIEAAVQTFEIKQGDSLHLTLNKWAKQAGWSEVQWNLPLETDFISGKTVKLQGDFMKVVTAIVTALRSEADLQVEFDPASKRFALNVLN